MQELNHVDRNKFYLTPLNEYIYVLGDVSTIKGQLISEVIDVSN